MLRKLSDILADFFKIGDSYHYTLGRDKSAFGMGTMELTDFNEYTEETVEEIAAHLEKAGVTVQRWIPLYERVPTVNDLDNYGQVLTVDNDRLIDCCHYMTIKEHPEWFTHWMPIPNAPRKDVSGDG